MTGVDWPGKSAIQSASLTAMWSGKPFSSEAPFCCGPRQVSHPRAGLAAFREARPPLRRTQARTRKAFLSFIAFVLNRDFVGPVKNPCRAQESRTGQIFSKAFRIANRYYLHV